MKAECATISREENACQRNTIIDQNTNDLVPPKYVGSLGG